MFEKVNHVVNLKGKKKQVPSMFIDERSFLLFGTDEGKLPSSMLVSRNIM